MAAASYAAGNFPKRLNKRESKVVETSKAAVEALLSHYIVGAIVATSVSPTTDFAALAVADKVLIIPAVAGNSQFVTVATAGTLPQAAVVGDLYLVLRAK